MIHLVFISLVIMATLLVYLLRPQKRPIVDRNIETLASDIMQGVDSNAASAKMDIDNMGSTRKSGPFIAYIVVQAKAEFGLLKRLEANRLMVRKFLLELMKAQGMRPTHIAQHLDIAVAMVFVPSDSDIIAHKINATREVYDRGEEMKSTWESFFGYFGPMKRFTSS